MLPLAIAGTALAGGSLLASLLNRPKYNTPDITGELNKISDLFAQARTQTMAGINSQYNDQRGLTANNLAARGIYSSPVSQASFGQLDKSRLQALGSADAQLSVNEANSRSSLLNSLMGINMQQQDKKNQANAALYGQFGSLGSSMLLSSLMGGQGGGQPSGINTAPPISGPNIPTPQSMFAGLFGTQPAQSNLIYGVGH